MSSSLFEDDEPPRWQRPEPPADWMGSAVVYGPAQTQGSKRGFLNKYTKRVVIVDDNAKELESWRGAWIAAMRKQRPATPIDSAVAIKILVYVRRPQAHYGSGKNAGVLKPTAPAVPPSGKDIDKVCRAILDALKMALWVTNDARVSDLEIKRRYDEAPERVWVWCWTMRSPTQPPPEFVESEPDELPPAESDVKF